MSAPNIELTLTPKDTFIFKDLSGPYFNPNWHFHPEYQISYILEGRGTRFVGDHVETFEEGDLVFVGPNLPHLWRSEERYFDSTNNLKTRALVIYFDHELFSLALLDKVEFHNVRKLVDHSNQGIEFSGRTRSVASELLYEIGLKEGFERIIALYEIINELANSTEFNLLSSPGYQNSFKGNDAENMRLVYNYVMKNFTKVISSKEIAEQLNMTTTSFCRYFKPRANKNFTRFVNEIRIGHARKLLIEDNLNIAQIGYHCGFNTLSNFNRQFKMIANMSPNEYKRLFIKIRSTE
ncbi:MAG: AraC-like DNA-binding protein [Saprospiraceae bacterium]|jgi:AraC-like DNA-binding protein